MKKIILAVILMAAAGGAAYWLLQKKKQNAATSFNQEQLIGKWKLDSLATKNDSVRLIIALMNTLDSNLMNYACDFRPDGKVLQLVNDSVLKDTITYEWVKGNHLVWQEHGDSTRQAFTIATLNKDSLVLQTKDSSAIYFKKAK